MNAGNIIRGARSRAHASLRELAGLARTSHSALASYEAGRKDPGVATLDRIVRSSGCELLVDLRPRVGGPDPGDRGRELLEVLELAGRFPARHGAALDYPAFGRR